jgi:hypothetical protein
MELIYMAGDRRRRSEPLPCDGAGFILQALVSLYLYSE